MECSPQESVESAIASVLKDKRFQIASPRVDNAKALAHGIIIKIKDHELIFEEFSKTLYDCIDAVCIMDTGLKSNKSQREKIWSQFHTLRSTKLDTYWGSFIKDLGIVNSDTGKILHMWQTVHGKT